MHFHADAYAEHPLWFMLELKRLQIFVNGVGNFSQYDGPGIFYLFLRKECFVVPTMTAIRTMAGRWPLHAGPRSNLEVSEAFLNGTLSAQIAVLIGTNWDAELIPEISEMIHIQRLP